MRGRAGIRELPGLDRHAEPVGQRRERADPLRVVMAARVVGEVEVEKDQVVACPKVGAFRGIQEVPSAAVGGRAGRRVTERQEHAATVGVQPEHLKGPDGQVDGTESHERDDAAGAGVDVEALVRQWTDLRPKGERGVVLAVCEPAERTAVVLLKRRLGMGTEDQVPGSSPGGVRAHRVGGQARADGRVERMDLAAVIEELEVALLARHGVTRASPRPRRRGRSGRARSSGTRARSGRACRWACRA